MLDLISFPTVIPGGPGYDAVLGCSDATNIWLSKDIHRNPEPNCGWNVKSNAKHHTSTPPNTMGIARFCTAHFKGPRGSKKVDDIDTIMAGNGWTLDDCRAFGALHQYYHGFTADCIISSKGIVSVSTAKKLNSAGAGCGWPITINADRVSQNANSAHKAVVVQNDYHLDSLTVPSAWNFSQVEHSGSARA